MHLLDDVTDRLSALRERTFFVVTGIPKSGTTWVNMLIDAHPEVRCYGEDDYNQLLGFFLQVANTYNQASVARNDPLPSSRFARFAEGDAERLLATAAALMLTEGDLPPMVKAVGTKFNDMVSNNTALFADLFKGGRLVHVRRDPRDVLVSVYFNELRNAPEETRRKWPSLAHAVAGVGPAVAASMRNAMSLAATFGPDGHDVRYEDLRAAPHDHAAALFRFLGVDASGATVDACVAETAFENVTGGRKSGEEDAGAFMRKGVVGDWREKFDAACTEALGRSGIAELLPAFGYDAD
jgi:hypothetical protein